MEKEKDNGYGEAERSQASAEAQTGVEVENRPNTATAALGKFKNVDALLKAYDCLQAEFTRRSQRLKELERAVENSEEGKTQESAAEKLRKKAEKVRLEEEKFDGFIAELEGASVRALSGEALSETKPTPLATEEGQTQEKEATLVQDPSKVGESKGVEGADERGDKREERFVAESRKEPSPTPDELYRLANGNEEVRLKIIGEYLHSVGKTGAPLVKGGSGLLSAPPVKAKTVREAGEMALRWFQREGAK